MRCRQMEIDPVLALGIFQEGVRAYKEGSFEYLNYKALLHLATDEENRIVDAHWQRERELANRDAWNTIRSLN